MIKIDDNDGTVIKIVHYTTIKSTNHKLYWVWSLTERSWTFENNIEKGKQRLKRTQHNDSDQTDDK